MKQALLGCFIVICVMCTGCSDARPETKTAEHAPNLSWPFGIESTAQKTEYGTAGENAVPLTLADCYELALIQSENIAINIDLIKQTDAHFLEALSIMLPHVSFVSTDTRSDMPPASSSLSSLRKTSSERAFTATQTLFSGFKAFAAIKASNYEKKQRANEKVRAEQLLLTDVSNAFYLLAEKRRDLKAFQNIRSVLVDRIRELREREKLGRSRTSEIVNASAQYYSVIASIKVAENSEVVTRQLLEFLTGGPVGKLIDSYPIPDKAEPLESYLEKAEGRPDVLAAKYAWELAKKGIVSADSDFLPTVSTTGNLYTQRTGTQKGTDWDIALQLDIPIFEGTEVLGRSKEAVLVAHEQEMTYRHTRRNAYYDIKDNYENFRTAVDIQGTLHKQYGMSLLNYHLQRKDYQRNLVNNLDVLAAIQSLRDAQRNYIHALYEAKRQYWGLRVASGAGFAEAKDDAF